MLAAGLSRRWGADNKLLAPVDGAAMIVRTVGAVLASSARPVIVVTGHEAWAIEGALAGMPVSFHHAADFTDGMSASVKAAVAAAPLGCDGILVCLGDMPWVRAKTLDTLAAAYDPSKGFAAVIPIFEARRGNPVLLGRRLFPEIARLSGDQGAARLFPGMAERIKEIVVDDPGVLRDADHPDALGAARSS